MGLCSSDTAKHKSTYVHGSSHWQSEKYVLPEKMILMRAENPRILPTSELKKWEDHSGKSYLHITSHQQSSNPRSDYCGRSNDLLSAEKLDKGWKSTQQESSSNVQFLLIDLETQMNRTSTAMLHILEMIMTKYSIMIESSRQFEAVRSNNKLRIFLFTTVKYVDSHWEILNGFEKIFVLGMCAKPVTKSFENIHDLIFEVADEFGRWFEEQACEHEKLGESSLAEQKREIINEMYSQLMNISTGNKRSNR